MSRVASFVIFTAFDDNVADQLSSLCRCPLLQWTIVVYNYRPQSQQDMVISNCIIFVRAEEHSGLQHNRNIVVTVDHRNHALLAFAEW